MYQTRWTPCVFACVRETRGNEAGRPFLTIYREKLYGGQRIMELKMVKQAEPQIHEGAVVDPTAVIHKNVVIGPFAVIGPNCEIGEGTVIGANAVIAKTCGWERITTSIPAPSSARTRRT